MSKSQKTVAFLRHGETELNRDGDRFCGTLDPRLAETGRMQAARAAAILRDVIPQIDEAWTSPLERARETAKIILCSADWKIREDLRELSFGQWEGLTKEQCRIATPDAFSAWSLDGYTNGPPGGESGQQAKKRVDTVLKALAESQASTILLVSHKTFLRLLVGTILGITPAAIRGSLEILPARLGILEVKGSKGTLRALNL